MPLPAYPDAQARRRRVLVAVMNNAEDLRRAASEGWYRIPQRRAPKRVGADFLAFYQTGAFRDGEAAHTVSYYAAVRRYRLLTRAELLPEQADHPRAGEYYFRIDIGPLQRLDRPVPAAKMRRITFINTTLAQLLTAHDVQDLYIQEDPFETLWTALRESRLKPLRNRLAGETPVDITLRARGGYLGIQCRDEGSTREHGFNQPPAPWTLLTVKPDAVEQDLPGCLRRVAAALIDLGGSV